MFLPIWPEPEALFAKSTPRKTGGGMPSQVKYGGFLKGGYPKMDGFYEGIPNLKWMMTEGSPILGNLHMIYIYT